MGNIIGFLAGIFGYLLNFIYSYVNNYGLAIILFTVAVQIILLPFTIRQQKTMIKNCLKELAIDDKMFTDRIIAYEISNAKNEMKTPEEYLLKNEADYRKSIMGKVYQLYQKRLKENNAFV